LQQRLGVATVADDQVDQGENNAAIGSAPSR